MELVYVFIFFVGLVIGSFLNVLILRLDRKKGLILGRSECPRCHKTLQWHDLIPVFSYIWLRAKCRYCKGKISFIYPIVELITAIAILLFFISNGLIFTIPNLIEVLVIIMLISIIFFDAIYYIIPDKIIFPLIGISFLQVFLLSQLSQYALKMTIIQGFLFSAIFAMIYLVSRGRWMGFGDAKLALFIGLGLAYPLGFWSIVFSIWAASIWGIVLMIMKRASGQTPLPFGSFMASTAVIFIIFKEESLYVIQKINLLF